MVHDYDSAAASKSATERLRAELARSNKAVYEKDLELDSTRRKNLDMAAELARVKEERDRPTEEVRRRLDALAAEWDARSEALFDEQPHTAQDYAARAKELRAAMKEGS